MDYAEEPWNPVWEYKLNWSGEFTENYIIREGKMTEMDEKEFEEWWLKEYGEKPITYFPHIHIWIDYFSAKKGWLASRRVLRENQNKSLDFLDDEKEDIYTKKDGAKLEGNMDEKIKEEEIERGNNPQSIKYLLSYIKELETQLDEWKEIASIHIHREHELEAGIKKLEENELRFPTLAEFSNLQDDHEELQASLKRLREGIEIAISNPYNHLNIKNELKKLLEKE